MALAFFAVQDYVDNHRIDFLSGNHWYFGDITDVQAGLAIASPGTEPQEVGTLLRHLPIFSFRGKICLSQGIGAFVPVPASERSLLRYAVSDDEGDQLSLGLSEEFTVMFW